MGTSPAASVAHNLNYFYFYLNLYLYLYFYFNFYFNFYFYPPTVGTLPAAAVAHNLNYFYLKSFFCFSQYCFLLHFYTVGDPLPATLASTILLPALLVLSCG